MGLATRSRHISALKKVPGGWRDIAPNGLQEVLLDPVLPINAG